MAGIIPELDQTLLSGSKFADVGYTAEYDKNKVNFYNAETVKIDAEAIIRGTDVHKQAYGEYP